MTGGTWINLLYEVMDGRGLVDAQVNRDDLPDLLDWVQREAQKDGDNLAYAKGRAASINSPD